MENQFEPRNEVRIDPAKPPRRGRAIRVVLIIIVALIIGIAGFFVYARYFTRSGPSQSGACKNDPELVNAFLAASNKNDRQQIIDLANKAKQKKDYDKDLDCLYIVTKEAIFLGNATEAEGNLNKIKVLYSGSNTFSTSILDFGSTLKEIGEDVEFLKLQASKADQNAFFGPPEEQ